MRKLMMKMSISVDGYVCGPNGEADWVFKSSDEASRAWIIGQSRGTGLFIMGRKSFEVMASYWPTAPGLLAAAMNEIPKALFTKTGFKVIDPVHTTTAEYSPAAASWAEVRVFDGDLAEGIRKLKSEPGNRSRRLRVPDLCGA
jgi:dihydrofolate reductase